MKTPAPRGKVAQFFRRLKTRSEANFQLITARDELRGTDRIDRRHGSAQIRRESPCQDSAEISFAGIGNHAISPASRSLDQLGIEQPFFYRSHLWLNSLPRKFC